MGANKQKGNLNYLPFISSTNSITKQTIRILIDTGANKNIVRPGILTNPDTSKNTSVNNISGNHTINKKGKANLIGYDIPTQTFYELHFHDFFDGILGSEYLAKHKGKVDYESESVEIAGIRIPYEKYFPAKKLYSHNIQIDTDKDGDWLVPTFQKLCSSAIVEPGLYRSCNNKSTIKILTNLKDAPKISKKLKLKVNNFETITPIPIEPKGKITSETLKKILRVGHLSKLEKEILYETILENQSVLLKPNEKLTATSAIKHQIITTDDQPVYTKSYRYPHAFKNDVEQQIRELLDQGIIRHSTSPYSSPIWVVPKKLDASGKRKVRVVIDYRKVNDKTVSDKFPIPQIEEILDSLGKSTYFTTLDLKSGFHQIEMDPDHQFKTAFSTAMGHFQFTRMPFGLKNAPATFQRAMNNILGEFIGKICFVYLDDIIIIGKDLRTHISNLGTILKRLAEFNLKIQLDKCEFMRRETEFLGHVITQDGIKPDPEKIKKILDWKLPENQTQIKQFLGLSGYYRRFIKDYSKIVKPMTKFLKKDQSVDVTDESYKAAFSKLKLIISSDQVLTYPDFDLPFILTTDASNYAIGAVLSQIQEKVERPIAFASRTLTKCETNYSTIEKEALAIMWGVNKFKAYVHGNKFTLFTDHKPLQYIKNCNKNQKLLNWRTELENYDYEIVYKEGKTNVVADALSRKTEDIVEVHINDIVSPILGNNPADPSDDEPSNEASEPDEVEIPEDEPRDEPTGDESDDDTIHSAESSADYYIHCVERPINYYRNQIIFRISRINTDITETPFPKFHRTIICRNTYDQDIIKDILIKYHNNKQTAIMAPEEVIPIIQEVYKLHFSEKGHFVITQLQVEDVTSEERQDVIISKEHNRAHRGVTEVENQIKRCYFFPKMISKIKIVNQTCKMCNLHKYERKPYNIKLSPRPTTDKPFDRVHMDIFQIDRHNFLSLVDSFSKHSQMISMETKNLTDVKTALSSYFGMYGTPRKIITDHETTFTSVQLKNFLDALNVELDYASCSESNGQVEKTHSTIIEILNSNKHKFANLDTKTLVSLAVALYNTSVHSATKFTPNEIIFNNNNLVDPDLIEETSQNLYKKVKINIEKAKLNQEKRNKNRENPPNLNEDQEVFVIPNIRKKLDPRARPTKANQITDKTFNNNRRIKRHKSKIKRLRKQ